MKLLDIGSYQAMSSTDAYVFSSKGPRTVKLEVLTTDQTIFTITGPDGVIDLALKAGQNNLTFSTQGETSIQADKDVYFYTSELYSVHIQNDGTKFTRPYTPDARNPELEKLAAEMQANNRRNMQIALAEQERRFEARLHQKELEKVNEDKPAGDPSEPEKSSETPTDTPEEKQGGSDKAKGGDGTGGEGGDV